MLRLRPSFHRNAILLGSVVASLSTSPSAAVGQSQLPLCPFDTKVIWTQCQGTTVDDGEEKYVGEFKDDRRNGHGTLTVANGKNTSVSSETARSTGKEFYISPTEPLNMGVNGITINLCPHSI